MNFVTTYSNLKLFYCTDGELARRDAELHLAGSIIVMERPNSPSVSSNAPLKLQHNSPAVGPADFDAIRLHSGILLLMHKSFRLGKIGLLLGAGYDV